MRTSRHSAEVLRHRDRQQPAHEPERIQQAQPATSGAQLGVRLQDDAQRRHVHERHPRQVGLDLADAYGEHLVEPRTVTFRVRDVELAESTSRTGCPCRCCGMSTCRRTGACGCAGVAPKTTHRTCCGVTASDASCARRLGEPPASSTGPEVQTRRHRTVSSRCSPTGCVCPAVARSTVTQSPRRTGALRRAARGTGEGRRLLQARVLSELRRAGRAGSSPCATGCAAEPRCTAIHTRHG